MPSSKGWMAEIAAALEAEGIVIGRASSPLTDWRRISIGLTDENSRARVALKRLPPR